MHTPASNQEQKPRAAARGAHTAWVGREELVSRRIPAGAGREDKGPAPCEAGKKRASRTLREVGAPAEAVCEFDHTGSKNGRAGMERVAWAGSEPATSGLWATRLGIRRPLSEPDPCGVDAIIQRLPTSFACRFLTQTRKPMVGIYQWRRQWPLGSSRRPAGLGSSGSISCNNYRNADFIRQVIFIGYPIVEFGRIG